jgi:type II secretory pathway component GspD/PulD (secretin)
MSLVVNQTPDIIEEIAALLKSLRRLQDREVSIEVKMVTLSESFYERMGVDFNMDIRTRNVNIEPNITSGINQNAPYINTLRTSGNIVGLQAPGVPTSNLDVPVTSTSFQLATPPFGGFQNNFADGGLSLGLSFLNNIQVSMFMEAAQGDRRINVMQAPKLTMFNGQSATMQIQDQQFFLTGITVSTANGQLVFTPNNNPYPIGVQMTIQPTISGDGTYVRMNINHQVTNLASTNVPLFPITTFITPVFEGGSQGQPIPFTQYVQQPTITSLLIQTTVAVPDGGTVLLGGFKTLSEGRNEFGPPIIGKIPYLDRLFRNTAYGRDAQSLLLMVTPRIIINREEQLRQTGTDQDNDTTGENQ